MPVLETIFILVNERLKIKDRPKHLHILFSKRWHPLAALTSAKEHAQNNLSILSPSPQSSLSGRIRVKIKLFMPFRCLTIETTIVIPHTISLLNSEKCPRK